MKTRIQTPLARARGAGSAHDGTHHWMMQRVTAIANLGLMAWVMWSVTQISSWSYEEFTAWLAMPLHAIGMILTVLSVFYHAALGSQVIAEDYIHNEALRLAKLIGIKLYFTAAGVACVFCVLKIALAG